MKRIIMFLTLAIIISISAGCGLREKLLSPPGEFIVPEGSLVAECTKDEDVFKFVYQLDGVYQYFINDIEQDEESVDYLIEQAYLHGSSVEAYLAVEYPNSCSVSNYVYTEKN